MGSNILFRRLDNIQKTAIDRAVDLLDDEGRCLIIMATGTGKTIVGSKIIKKQKDKKILWLTQTDELITQTRADLQGIFGEKNVGLYKSKTKSLTESIIVASVQTISMEHNLKNIRSNLFDLMIVDEAHHSGAMTWRRVIEFFKCKKLGLTATPIRNDDVGLGQFFGSAAFNLSYDEAKKLKLISEEIYRVILTNSKLEGVITSRGEYSPKDLDRLVISHDRNQIILDSYLKYGRSFMKNSGLPFKTICFCVSVAHCERMKELFTKAGIKSDILVSISKRGHSSGFFSRLNMRHQRKEIYESFLSGDTEILCVVNMLNEGKNIPNVGCLLMTRPTRSRIIFQQQVGRGCRRIEGKKHEFMILDYVDMMNQKYPPMTLSRITSKEYSYNEIIFDYWKGKDPIQIDEIISYLSPQFSFFPDDKWNKALVAKILLEFQQKHKRISCLDLVPTKTGLPTRTTIKRFWPTVKECFNELKIPFRPKNNWSKEECVELIKAFKEKHGKISVADLGQKNNLPSQNQIYSFWGTWSSFCKSNDIGMTYLGLGRKKKIRIPRPPSPHQNVWKNKYSINKKTWTYKASFIQGGKRYYVGSFRDPETARNAVLQKRKELEGKLK